MPLTTFRKRSRSSVKSAAEVPEIVVLWLLRLLVPLSAHRDFTGADGFRSDSVARAIGLGHWLDPEPGPAEPDVDGLLELLGDESPSRSPSFDVRAARSALRRLHGAAERKLATVSPPWTLQKNVDRLATLVGLSKSDERILAFAVISHYEGLLDEAFGWVGDLSSARLFRVLAVVLALPEPEVRKSLSPHGVLARSGLVTIDRHGMSNLRGKMNLLSEQFGDQILSTDAEPRARASRPT